MRETDALRRPQALAVPMIGVVVMVLVAAMVITPAVAGPWLADARTATPVLRGPLVVGVDRDGNAWIPAAHPPAAITEAQLAARLRDDYALRGDRSGVLHLAADWRAPYRRVQAVLRAAARAGVRDVELIVECPRGKEFLHDECHR